MLKFLLISFFLFGFALGLKSQNHYSPDFTWGNAFYFNMNVGETIFYNNVEIKLIRIKNHFNQIKIGNDTIWAKVSRRTPAVNAGFLRIFVADNKNVKALTSEKQVHGLLKKDALICISNYDIPLLEPNSFQFPVSFNNGFIWSAEEDSYMFSYISSAERKLKGNTTNDGIDFDLHDARGIEKHWIVAIENSTVVWVEDNNQDKAGKEACVLLIELIDKNWIPKIEEGERKNIAKTITNLFDLSHTKRNEKSNPDESFYQQFKGQLMDGERYYDFLESKKYVKKFNKIGKNN